MLPAVPDSGSLGSSVFVICGENWWTETYTRSVNSFKNIPVKTPILTVFSHLPKHLLHVLHSYSPRTPRVLHTHNVTSPWRTPVKTCTLSPDDAHQSIYNPGLTTCVSGAPRSPVSPSTNLGQGSDTLGHTATSPDLSHCWQSPARPTSWQLAGSVL